MFDTLKWATDLDASGFASGAQKVNSQLGEMGFRTNAAQMNLGMMGTVLGTLANPMTAVALAATAVGGALVGSAQAAAAWQSSMAGVSKTTGLSGQDLNTLSKELLDMSTEMPAAASEIANVAQAAGSLGIAAQDIAEFTEVAIQMGVGFEMSADQAAMSGAKILTSFKLETTADNMNKLGSVVNAMGDSFAATEPQVLDFLNRASFLNTTMGQTIPQIAALGTVLISTGMDSEVAATGLKSFLNMATSTTSRKGGLDNWAKLMNISVDELKANLAGDFNQTLIDTANTIAAIEDPVERFQKAVALAGTEGAPAILKLAGTQEDLQKALGLTNAEWEKAQSLQKTYAAQSETFNSQWQIFTNTIGMAGTELGTVLLPGLTQFASDLTVLTKAAIDAGEAIWGWIAARDAAFGAKEGGRSALSAEDLKAYADMGVITLTEEERAKVYGTQIGDDIARELTENEKLRNAGAEAIQAGIDAGVFNEAGEAAGEVVSESMKTTLINQAAGVSTAWADSVSQAMKDYGVGMLYTGSGNSKWKDSIGQVVSSTVHEGVGIAAVKDATVGKTYVVLKTENGAEIDRRDIYSGEFAGDTMGAIYDMIAKNDVLGDLSEIGSAELAGDLGRADVLKLQGPKIEIEAESLWDSADNQRSWIKYMDENKELAEKAGDEIMYALYNAQAKALDDPTLSESMGIVMKGALEPGSVSSDMFNQALGDIIDAGYVSEAHRASIEAIATEDAETYASKLYGSLENSEEKRSLAEVISGGLEGVEDVTAWIKNEYQPTLKTEMGEMNKIWDTGYSENREVVREYLDELKKDHEEHSDWFEDWQNEYIDLLQAGGITTDQFLNVWDETANKMQENASAAIDDIKTTNAMFYGEFLSDNAEWQSYVNENGGYVGPTSLYGGYREALEEERRKAQEVNSYWGITTVGSIGNYEPIPQKVELDDEQARSDLDALISDIETKVVKLHVSLDMDVSAQVNTLVPLIEDVVAGALAAL